MRGATKKLTDTQIESRIKNARREIIEGRGRPILLGDGHGLTLQITKTGTASWLYRYMRRRKPVAVGLGPYPTVTLKAARERAETQRQLLAHGQDPLEVKKRSAAAAERDTFAVCAKAYIDDHRAEWKSEKHIQQWENTLATYAFPVMGEMPVSGITTGDVVRVLKPIWVPKHETANRVRGRIASILDWASAHELRTGDNPARWDGHLEYLLAKTTPRQRQQRHHPALPYVELPRFIEDLELQEGMARWALEFLILTASRTSEVTGARWCEIDLANNVWTVPAERMKGAKEHRIPLVPRAIEILDAVKPLRVGQYVFPGGRRDRPLSNMAMAMLLRRMDYTEATVHGFRSTFRDYIGAETQHDFYTAEAALAHKLKDKATAAYARSDLLGKRAAMMRDWERYCRFVVSRVGSTDAGMREPITNPENEIA